MSKRPVATEEEETSNRVCRPCRWAMYQVQTNLSVQTVQTNCGGEVGGGICKSVIRSGRNYTFANPTSHLSPAVGLHGLYGEVGLH